MAFPLSHPAIVLPLTLLPKPWVSATALIIGSLVPDAEYLLRMKLESTHAGTWAGLFYFDLPIGLALCFLFHLLIRDELIRHLPLSLRKRFEAYTSFNWTSHFRKYWPAIIVSILVGGATHILWDELDLTHPYGHVYRSLYTWSSAFVTGESQLILIRTIQHFPSAIGLIILIWVIWKMPAQDIGSRVNILPYWLFIVGFGILFMIFRLLLFPPESLYAEAVLSLVSGSVLGMMARQWLVVSG